MKREPRVAVLGVGAVGGYLTAKLTAGPLQANPPALIARPRVAEAIEQDGLRLVESDAMSVVRPPVSTGVGDLDPFDTVVLAVRTYDVASAMPTVERLTGGQGIVIAMQNGVGSEEELVQALGKERVVAGTLTVSVGMDSPGVVHRYSKRGGVAFAPLGQEGGVAESVVDLFRATDLPTQAVDDYRSLRWSKLLLNMLGAATTATLDVDIKQVMRDPDLFALEQRAFREAGAVMDAMGIETIDLPGYPVTLARHVMRFPRPLAQAALGRRIAKSRSGQSPGTRADMKRGRSEIPWYNGAVVRAGVEVGVPTSVNGVLTEIAESLVKDEGERERYRGRKDLLLRAVKGT